jgi:hypothetical protein
MIPNSEWLFFHKGKQRARDGRGKRPADRFHIFLNQLIGGDLQQQPDPFFARRIFVEKTQVAIGQIRGCAQLIKLERLP